MTVCISTLLGYFVGAQFDTEEYGGVVGAVSGLALALAEPSAHFIGTRYTLEDRQIRTLTACTRMTICGTTYTLFRAAGLINQTFNDLFLSGGYTGLLAIVPLFVAFEQWGLKRVHKMVVT